MTIERRPPTSPHPAAAPAGELKRIPLPPLPHFRRPEAVKPVPAATLQAPAAVSHLEMSELLGPDHEGGIVPAIESVMSQRTGMTGATILNDLVDQIEKGLEKDLARAPMDMLVRGYRRVVACAGGPTLGRSVVPGPSHSERRTEE